MSAGQFAESADGFGTLRQFARRERPLERCELCSLGLRPDHPHLIEVPQRKLLCTCDACAILFEGQSDTKYKRVPRRVLFLKDFQLSDSQWDGLMVPIEMAFFFRSTPEDRIIALYPSPAGPTESLLSLDTWADLEETNPILKQMEADTTALLVNRVGHVRGAAPAEYFLVPIDQCYKLVGLIRTHWRGLSGGTEVWRELGAFFMALKKSSNFGNEGPHA